MKARHLAYCFWIVIAVLGGICWVVPEGGWTIGGWTLRWPTWQEAVIGDRDSVIGDRDSVIGDSVIGDSVIGNRDEVIGDRDTVIGDRDEVTEVKVVIPTVEVDSSDTRVYLSAFYASLDSTAKMPIRVVHYGDSQTEEDRITNIVRERLQQRFGGGGAGLLPLHQTIPTRTVRQWLSIDGVVQTTKGGPKRHIVYGLRSMRDSLEDYGVMGQVAVMDSQLVAGSDEVVMNIEPMNKKRSATSYFNRVRLLSQGVSGFIYAQDSIYDLPENAIAVLPDSCVRCEIHLQGQGRVYGVSIEDSVGVMVDNIPMRGCSGNIFTRIDSASLQSYFAATNTRLIILQFGGNMIPQTENPSTISGYVNILRQQVRYIRQCAPQASILFIGPSDMSTRVDGEMMTYPLIPYLDQLLAKMAREEAIAYWSMYQAMGGKNSMIAWQEKGLAGSDYVHFTRAGANKVGRMLSDWILDALPQ